MNHFFGLPCYDIGAYSYNTLAVRNAMCTLGGNVMVKRSQRSLLANNFNALLCDAVNAKKMGVRYFWLLHDDIIPIGKTWAVDMLGIMQRTGVRVLSAVAPLRNDSGESSTAIQGRTEWDAKRLRLDEIGGWRSDDDKLLINTGCLLIDLEGEWHAGLCFTIRDRIILMPNGEREAQVIPEDWGMSQWLAKHQIPYGCTSKIRLLHYDIRRKKAYKNWVDK